MIEYGYCDECGEYYEQLRPYLYNNNLLICLCADCYEREINAGDYDPALERGGEW